MSMLYWLSNGDPTKIEELKKIKVTDAVYFSYRKRIDQLNKILSEL